LTYLKNQCAKIYKKNGYKRSFSKKNAPTLDIVKKYNIIAAQLNKIKFL